MPCSPKSESFWLKLAYPNAGTVPGKDALFVERSGDISGRTTAILQFSSELEQTWHSYY
jgi:hypothetical protein